MTRSTHTEPTTDFASAAMIRVLAQGMRELGLEPEPELAGALPRGATVPLDQKRRLVGSAVAQGGVGCLALLGRGLHRLADEPTHRALASARDAQDLLLRWGRLERYIHSRHRVEVLALADDEVRLAHVARPGHPPPLPAEDLVVLGVLAALLEAVGAVGVTARVGDVPVFPEPDAEALAAAVQQGRTAAWSVRWTRLEAPPRPAGSGAATTARVAAPATWPAHAQDSFLRLCQDLANPLTLPALASAQGEAPRSFQRGLARAGLSYTQLLGEARCRSAAWWLVQTAAPAAEVGYVCGYADQSHFTRDFRDRVGLTPLRYRAEFSVPA
jgi:AraC-like DNA-binding protein